MKRCSRIEGFFKKSYQERLAILKNFAGLSDSCVEFLLKKRSESSFTEKMSENVISSFALPYSLAANFLINGIDYLVPMVTEESSVVAAASNAAKLARTLGGFIASADRSLMIGQIHLINVSDVQAVKNVIEERKLEILELANKKDSTLVHLGGGAVDLTLNYSSVQSLGNVLTVHLVVDVKDAMGANIVNTMAEFIALELEKLVGVKALMSIVSNLALSRMARVKAVWSVKELGKDTVEKIVQANDVAKIDIFRAVTHNKGIMNGIDAVAIATGNDFRALEAAAYGFASMNAQYKPLTDYFIDDAGNLVGAIELPISVGIVGGSTRVNPMAKLSIELLGVKTASELAQIIASVGLAQNFAALRALVGQGIQQGHMRLHNQKFADPEKKINLRKAR